LEQRSSVEQVEIAPLAIIGVDLFRSGEIALREFPIEN
jgi:hypothetical protein